MNKYPNKLINNSILALLDKLFVNISFANASDDLLEYKKIVLFSIKNISFFGHKPVNKIHPFLKNADILLVTLKEGKVFDATIPGKFSTYLKYNKPILGLIGGETKNLINNNSLGFALNNFRSKNNNLKLFKFLKKTKLNKLNNTSYIKNNFSKEKILNKLDYYFHENKIKLRFITKSNQIKFENNFVLSAFNLAFIGSWVSKDIKIYNELYCWPDGLFKNTLLKNIYGLYYS